MTNNAARIETITTTQLHHATKKKAAKMAAILDSEYPAIQIAPVANDDESKVVGWAAYSEQPGEDGETTRVDLWEGEKLPDLADLLEAAEDAGIDPEEGAEDEDTGPSGSVVGHVYRVRYKEASSTGQSNGDWLAERLATDTINGDGNLDVDAFQSVLDKNEVDQSGAWARLPQSGQKGWAGRWRMNGRQILEKHVARAGVYRTPDGHEIEPASDWLQGTRTKHAKWIEKQDKIEKALRQDD